jgi:exopolysaccharide production protein ExoQ
MVGRHVVSIASAIALLFVFAFAISWTNGWDQDALLTALVVCAVPVVPLLAYAMLRALEGDRTLGPLLAILLIVVVTVVFRLRAYDDKSIDFQVILKLGSIALMAASSLLFFLGNGSARPGSAGMISWLVFLAYLCATAAYSPTPLLSLIYALSLAIGLLFTGYLVECYGVEKTVDILLISGFVIIIPSVAAYAVQPSLVSMHGWSGGTFGDIDRLRGFTQSGNAIGGIASLCVVLLLLFPGRLLRFSGELLFIPAIGALLGVALLCLVWSNHRAGLASAMVAVAAYYTFRRGMTLKVLTFGLLGMLGAAIFAAYSNEILSLLSRSGNAEEISTATGRTLIWNVVLEYWQQRPFFGYGYSSSLQYLPNDPRLFGVAAHAHDAYLELLFSGGVIALALFLIALAFTIFPLRKGMLRPACLLLYFLVRGITEAAPMNNLLEFSTFGFWLSIWLLRAPSTVSKSAAAAEIAWSNGNPAMPRRELTGDYRDQRRYHR